MFIKHLGGCPRTLCFLRLPRQTGHRVFPRTAFRRPSPLAYQQPLSLIHSLEPLTRSCVPARLCFSASSFSSCRRLFRFPGQSRLRAWTPTRVHSIAAARTAHSRIRSLSAIHDRSTAVRSGRLMLFRPSSLQGRSDFPCAHNAPLAGVTQLETRLLPVESGRDAGSSGPLSRHLSLHAAVLTPGPRPVQMPFASRSTMAFPINVEGRRVARTTRFIPQTASPSYSRPLSGYEAATFVFVLRPAGLASIPDWVRPASMACQPVATPCRGKFRPVVTSRTRPQPTYPKEQLV